MASKYVRGEELTESPMRYAPENELGVVFLFAGIAKRWRLRIDRIQAAFPDCIAYQKVKGGEKRVRIEFEYRSKNFAQHKHNAKQCDWIVCWQHDWVDVPEHLHILELRREFGLGFNVWTVAVGDPYKDLLSNSNSEIEWRVPGEAQSGDIVLSYLNSPERYIKHVCVIKSRPWRKKGLDFRANVKTLATLNSPVFLNDLQRHRMLSTAGFVRGKLQGRMNATEYWPYLYDLIIRRNPSIIRRLKKFAPENLR